MLWRQLGGIVELLLLQTSWSPPYYHVHVRSHSPPPPTAERRGSGEIREKAEEEEKRRDLSCPLCEISAFCGGQRRICIRASITAKKPHSAWPQDRDSAPSYTTRSSSLPRSGRPTARPSSGRG